MTINPPLPSELLLTATELHWTFLNWHGRQWLWPEWGAALNSLRPGHQPLTPAEIRMLTDHFISLGWIQEQPAIQTTIRRKWLFRITSHRCFRCENTDQQTFHTTHCLSCHSPTCTYCERCIEFGRAKTCTPLIRIIHVPADRPPIAQPDLPVSPERRPSCDQTNQAVKQESQWQLTPAQQKAADAMIAATKQGGRFLLQAVTGAGKTEMMFPLIEYTIRHQRRILIATPRKDVVLELYPRLCHAFPDIQVTALYGGCPNPWAGGPIVTATTHQLIRYREAFDVIVLDECDAFPFHNDAMLEAIAWRTLKPAGLFVYLTATPPEALAAEAAGGAITFEQIAGRYHGKPLPVPKTVRMRPAAVQNTLPPALIKSIAKTLERGAQLFFFVPVVALVGEMTGRICASFPEVIAEGTYAADPEREQRVSRFRKGEIRILVTTSILERGITVPKTDVIVWQADHRLFETAALVQMAGRAGRSMADAEAAGVTFFSTHYNQAQADAIRQIRAKNDIIQKKR